MKLEMETQFDSQRETFATLPFFDDTNCADNKSAYAGKAGIEFFCGFFS